MKHVTRHLVPSKKKTILHTGRLDPALAMERVKGRSCFKFRWNSSWHRSPSLRCGGATARGRNPVRPRSPAVRGPWGTSTPVGRRFVDWLVRMVRQRSSKAACHGGCMRRQFQDGKDTCYILRPNGREVGVLPAKANLSN